MKTAWLYIGSVVVGALLIVVVHYSYIYGWEYLWPAAVGVTTAVCFQFGRWARDERD